MNRERDFVYLNNVFFFHLFGLQLISVFAISRTSSKIGIARMLVRYTDASDTPQRFMLKLTDQLPRTVPLKKECRDFAFYEFEWNITRKFQVAVQLATFHNKTFKWLLWLDFFIGHGVIIEVRWPSLAACPIFSNAAYLWSSEIMTLLWPKHKKELRLWLTRGSHSSIHKAGTSFEYFTVSVWNMASSTPVASHLTTGVISEIVSQFSAHRYEPVEVMYTCFMLIRKH